MRWQARGGIDSVGRPLEPVSQAHQKPRRGENEPSIVVIPAEAGIQARDYH